MPFLIQEDQAEILRIDARARSIARTMMVEENSEQVELSIKSGDRTHRIAAAFYYQFRLDPDPCLMHLLADQDPLVVEAAHIALVIIANDKKFKAGPYPRGHLVDFGPWMSRAAGGGLGPTPEDGTAMRRDAIDLWQSHFEGIARRRAGGLVGKAIDSGKTRREAGQAESKEP